MKPLLVLLAICAAGILLFEGKHWLLLAGLKKGGEWGYRAEFEQSLDLYGVVLEERSQQPVAGAKVELGPIDQPGMGSRDSAPVTVQTDAQGRFSFTGHRGLDLYVRACSRYICGPRRGSPA